MEHVPGHSCAELLRDRGHLDVDEAIDIVSQSCRGLDYAHRNGVVHRDVKPGNLLVSETQNVKLADFGIARAVDQSSITQVGSVLGTAAYLAPEQARGEEAGPRADIYSLGVVTYQLLSGRLPYEAASLSELALRQQRESPTPLNELNPGVNRELAQAVAMALSIDQEGRPRDAILFGETLRNGLNGLAPVGATAPTAHLGTGAATNVLPGRAPGAGEPLTGDATAATRLDAAPRGRSSRQLEPIPAPPRRRQPAPAGRSPRAVPREAPPRRRGRAMRRFMVFLLLLFVFVAAVAVAVVIATGTSNTMVHFRKVVGADAQHAINSFRDLVNQYTK